MKHWFIIFLLSGIALVFPEGFSQADGDDRPQTIDTPCLPGIYLQTPQECILVGPAAYLTERAVILAEIESQSEIFLPVDPSFGETSYQYAKIYSERGFVFSSLEDAVEGSNVSRLIQPGFNYVSFTEEVDVDGRSYYQIGFREWIRARDVDRFVVPTDFSGVTLTGTPERPFGWVLYETPAYKIPTFNNPEIAGNLTRHQIIQVFDTQVISGFEWYLVAPGEWIEQRKIALVYPRQTPPHGVRNGRWVEINLFEQTTAVYERGEMVFATLTTSGSTEFYTRPGLFQITEKLETTPMRGGRDEETYYLEDVPWTMYFDQRRAFHGEYWHDHLGYRSSHGCANLSFADADWLYNWAEVGDWVYVWDPSGRTPVIEALFTALIPEIYTREDLLE
ncbi:MAG: L,D-transpeptidase [Chloroflexi bacterium]|nr:L,D-transpeptidase [Chloroflexota bacterium]